MAHISVQNVSLNYPILNYDARSLRNHILSLGTGGRVKANAGKHIIVEALKSVSWEFVQGDRVGLVGANGAGKSTLLRVLAGIYFPSGGKVVRQGRVTTLFDLSLGMDSEATGLQNIRLGGLLRGLRGRALERMVEQAAEFSGLDKFLAMPVRTYSAGMQTRLGFSVATSVNPEILLIDEVFGAGDQDFVQKAEKRMNDLISASKIIVFATHQPALMRAVCTKALLLDHGQLIESGDVDQVLKRYGSHG